MRVQNWIGLGFSLVSSALILLYMGIFHAQSLMLTLKLFFGIILFGVVVLEVLSRYKTYSLRRQGLYPPVKQATLEDVKALLGANEKLRAIQLYRKMHRVSLQEALNCINRIEIR